MKVVLTKNEIKLFKSFVDKLGKETGGQMDVDRNGKIKEITLFTGDKAGITPDLNHAFKVAWHTHVCDTKTCTNQKLPIPPSPNDLKTSLIMNCINQTKIDILFTIEGIYAYWPQPKLIRNCKSKEYEYFSEVYESGETLYNKVAKNYQSPEQKRQNIINRYKKKGYTIKFWTWNKAQKGITISKR